jgi:hypothetical protein
MFKVVESNQSCRKGVESIFESNDILPMTKIMRATLAIACVAGPQF